MEDIQQYKGHQILLKSGRLVMTSKTNDVFINSRRYINLSAGDKVTIDVGVIDSDKQENMFLVNAPKIQFGLERYGKAEKTVKSDELKKIFIELIDRINEFNELMSSIAITSPTPIFGAIYKVNASKLNADLNLIKTKLDNFKSKITYTI